MAFDFRRLFSVFLVGHFIILWNILYGLGRIRIYIMIMSMYRELDD